MPRDKKITKGSVEDGTPKGAAPVPDVERQLSPPTDIVKQPKGPRDRKKKVATISPGDSAPTLDTIDSKASVEKATVNTIGSVAVKAAVTENVSKSNSTQGTVNRKTEITDTTPDTTASVSSKKSKSQNANEKISAKKVASEPIAAVHANPASTKETEEDKNVAAVSDAEYR